MTVPIIRIAPDDEALFERILEDLIVPMVAEMALVEPDPGKVGAKVYEPIEAGRCWVAIDDDTGSAIGVIGLKEVEWDYAEGTFLTDSYFYVAADVRFGAVGVPLMRHARDCAREEAKVLLVSRISPRRATSRGAFGLYAEVAGFLPVGDVTRFA